MSNVGYATLQVIPSLRGAQADIDRQLRSIDGTGAGRHLGGGMASGLKSVLGPAIVAVGIHEAIDLGGTLLDAATESLKVTKQTDAVLASMGQSAGLSSKGVGDLADRLSFMSGVDDELIQSGENVLLTFGKVRNEVGKGNNVFDRGSEAALNMSVALKQDLQSANIQIGKALNDPIKGITALTRAGVSFTQQQKDQIRVLTESGDTLGAQKIILGELENQFGGSAAAQATAADRLGVVVGNLEEDLGAKLLPVAEDVANFLSNNLPGAIDTAGRFFGAFGDIIGNTVRLFQDEGLGGVFSALGAEIEEQAPILGGKMLVLGGKLVDWVGPQIPPLLEALAGVLADVAVWLLDPGVGLLADAVAVLVPALVDWVLTDALPGLLEALPDMLAGMTEWLATDAVPAMVRGGKDMGGALIDGFWDGIKEAVTPDDSTMDFEIPGTGIKLPVPVLAKGGVMGGPRGVHSLAFVAGGETVLPTHELPLSAFLPQHDGLASGRGAVGNTYIQNIYNPTPEPASDSVRALRKVGRQVAA